MSHSRSNLLYDDCESITGRKLLTALFPALEISTIEDNLLIRIQLALECALRAGRVMQKGRDKGGFDITYKGIRDLVTTIDKQVEREIVVDILNSFPEDAILAEEGSERISDDHVKVNNSTWVIDPVDGTTNFVRGHLHCAVSIAYAEGDLLKFGLVYAPFINEIYLAVRDQGAYDQHGGIKVSNVTELSRAVIATGLPYDRSDCEGLVDRMRFIIENCADLRRNGSAALDLCWVACGKVDGYIESVKPWDMAAGLLIALEAGARYTNLGLPEIPSEIFRCDNLLVSTPGIFEAMRSGLQK